MGMIGVRSHFLKYDNMYTIIYNMCICMYVYIYISEKHVA